MVNSDLMVEPAYAADLIQRRQRSEFLCKFILVITVFQLVVCLILIFYHSLLLEMSSK